MVFCLGPRVDRDVYNERLYRNGLGLLPGRLLKDDVSTRRPYVLYGEEEAFHLPPLKEFASQQYRASLSSVRFRCVTCE